MNDIEIPTESKAKVSTRIDTVAHDILRKLSVEKYGSTSNMSAVLTEAVRFVHDPFPTQRVAKQKYANDIDVYARDPDESGSKVIHWTAPTELAEEMRSLGTSNREFIESSIYEYEAYYTEMDESFSSKNSKEVMDWDVLEDNYSITQDMGDVEGVNVPSKPSSRRPFIYSIVDDGGISSFSAFSKVYYDQLESEYGVSGLPKEETRRKDWQALIDEKHLIPTPEKMAERPIKTVESDTKAYYPRRAVDAVEDILEDYIEEMEQWVDRKNSLGESYDMTDAVFQQRENALSVLSTYEIPELEKYADRAEELHNRMVGELTSSFGGDA